MVELFYLKQFLSLAVPIRINFKLGKSRRRGADVEDHSSRNNPSAGKLHLSELGK